MARNAIAVVNLPSENADKRTIYELSYKSICFYANRHDIDVHVINEIKYSKEWPSVPHLEKFQAIDLLDSYARVLSLDLDILINPTAPSIFEAYPDEYYVYGYDEGNLPWVQDDIRLFEQRYNVDMQGRMFNGGVMLWAQSARVLTKYFNPALFYQSFGGTAGEQSFVNAMLVRYGIECKLMDRKWNWCPYAEPDASNFHRRLDAHFIHYASDGHWINLPSKIHQVPYDAWLLGGEEW